MRTVLFAGAIVLSGLIVLQATQALAVVCADGVKRAGCAGPNAVVVVKKPPPVVVCKTVWVNGVKVRRCA
ncbi:MAG: hypothetical protein J0I29_13585 [Rhizobiales bacterium]|nr:hypothetical protein [Hyphomicrobiales bacterium]